MSSQDTQDYSLTVGKIGAPHGVRGDMRLFSYTENPEAIFSYPLRIKGTKESASVTRKGTLKNCFIVSIDGVDTRERAQELTGRSLVTYRGALERIEEDDQWYVEDLIGLHVISDAGEPLGTLKAIDNFGAGDVMEIVGDSGKKNVYLPFSDDFVDEVDIEKKVIRMHEFTVYD